ncbi:Protein polybromo-1 [Pseudocercospora fuligena]|uniref:Protein polybromo-1 n=1 Tax=Pseudocercospora fuligena TaxID=685502 RepID=A0A8H6REA1_9PEZI|nr:Protein polybromo-1 [Pseudocercospora fuligena]
MDSSRKRKAPPNATPTNTEGSASKKIKLLNSNPAPQANGDSNLSAVQRVGFKLITQLSKASDKTNRPITDAFEELPSREELPEYYQVTRLPIAISTIKEKLQKDAYPTVSALESDFKRMIQNAKDYNEPKSIIYEDAERIRKLIYNFMKVNNPEYSRNPSYTAVATPIPDAAAPPPSTKITLTNGSHAKENSKPVQSREPAKDEQASKDASTKLRLSVAPKLSEPPSDRKSSVAPSAATGGDDMEPIDMDFTGKSFQEAQEMICAEAIQYTDDDGMAIFTPFVFLPSRKLEDYYKVIKHPVSIKGVQKLVKGVHGRNPPTGHTDFKTWDQFEQEVSFIWRNARDYNEDGSDMYQLANEFEEYFKSRLAEAKEKVEEPASTRLKLGGPKPPQKTGITLNLSQHRASPTPGVSVDNEALARQRAMVQAGANGQQAQQRPTPTVNGVKPSPQPTATDAPRPPSSAQLPTPPGGVKNEKMSTMSPAPQQALSAQPLTNGMMPPPLMRPPSGSPFPGGMAAHAPSYHYAPPHALPMTALRKYPASQALLPVVKLSTHPQLRNITTPYSLDITPHATLSHQSTTITLPSTHYYMSIAPTISRELAMGRAYKLFVSVNGTRLTQRDTQFHADTGKRTHVYEGSLAQGVNRIEIECAAAKIGENGDGKGLDVEKVTVFANLLRA